MSFGHYGISPSNPAYSSTHYSSYVPRSSTVTGGYGSVVGVTGYSGGLPNYYQSLPSYGLVYGSKSSSIGSLPVHNEQGSRYNGNRYQPHGYDSLLSKSSRSERVLSSLPVKTSYSPRLGNYNRSFIFPDPNKDDFKKLYEEQKKVNEVIRKQMEEVRQELNILQPDTDRSDTSTISAEDDPTMKTSAKEELCRRIEQLQLELGDLKKIKEENAALTEENKSLSRVVGKLSK